MEPEPPDIQPLVVPALVLDAPFDIQALFADYFDQMISRLILGHTLSFPLPTAEELVREKQRILSLYSDSLIT